VALLDEVTDWESILVGVTRCETLVCHVEESVVLALLNSIADLLPLLRSWIDTSWVVGASVEQENAALLGTLDIVDQALEVEANGVLVVVSVLGNLQTGVLEDSTVVCPRWVGDVDLLCAWVPACEELTTDAESASARDGLCDDEAVECAGTLTICEKGSSLGELRDTGDAGVFLVGLRSNDLVLSNANGREHVWLSLVVAVGTNT